MPLPIESTDNFTLEDYYNLPDDVRAEFIEGKIYYMASPTQEHQEISGEVFRRIANYIAEKGGPCKVLTAPFDVKVNENKDDIVQPDIIVVCDPQKLDGKKCNGAPNWIIEIASPSNITNDYVRKLKLYKEAGVEEYWIINPEEKTIVVYEFNNKNGETVSEYSFENRVKPSIYEDFVIDFKEVSEIVY